MPDSTPDTATHHVSRPMHLGNGDVPIAQHFADLARRLAGEADSSAVLQRVVDTAVADVPGAEFAGITVIDRNKAHTPAASDELVRAIDAGQYATGQGPCLEAVADRFVIRCADLRAEQRWSDFYSVVAPTGVRSMLSTRMFVDSDSGGVGALNLYSRTLDAFPDEAVDIATLLAAHAAVAMQTSETTENLRIALGSRDIIGQAKGILMERHRLTADQAFDLLIQVSQYTHRKLRDIAEELTVSGLLPAQLNEGTGEIPPAVARR